MKKSDETRKHIITVATDLFNKNGFNMTSTKALAQAMDVSEALIFKYFKTKKNLLTAIIVETTEQFKKNSLPEINSILKLDIPALDRLEKFMRNRYDFFIDNEPVITILINQILFDETIRKTLNNLISDYVDPIIITLLEEAMPEHTKNTIHTYKDIVKGFIFDVIVHICILKKPCPYSIDEKLKIMKGGL